MKVTFFLAALLIASVESANILALFTSASPSHVIVDMAVVKALIAKGHKVTVATTLTLKDENPEYKHILLRPDEHSLTSIENGMSEMSNAQNPIEKFKLMVNNLAVMTQLQYDGLRIDEFQTLIQSEKFDLVMSGHFLNSFHLVVSAQLKLPVILVYAAQPAGFVNSYTGNPTFGSFVPNQLATNKQPMSFGDRLKSFLANGFFNILHDYANYKFGQYYE